MEVILNGQCCKEAPEEDQKAQIPQAEEDEPTQEQVAALPASLSRKKKEKAVRNRTAFFHCLVPPSNPFALAIPAGRGRMRSASVRLSGSAVYLL
jgi:hypothetical protein